MMLKRRLSVSKEEECHSLPTALTPSDSSHPAASPTSSATTGCLGDQQRVDKLLFKDVGRLAGRVAWHIKGPKNTGMSAVPRKPIFCVVLADGDQWSIEAEWPDGTIARFGAFRACGALDKYAVGSAAARTDLIHWCGTVARR